MGQDWGANDRVVAPGAPARGIFLPPVADANKAATARATTARAATDEAQLPYAADTARAQRDKAVADARKAAQEADAQNLPPDPALAASIAGLGLDELISSISAARREVGTGRATGVTGAIARMIPGSTANDLAGSLESIKGAAILEKLSALKKASANGASGMGALSEREGDRLASSIAALSPNLSDPKLMEGLATMERHARALQAIAAGKNPDDPRVAQQFGIATTAPRPAAAMAAPVGGGPGGPGGPGGSGGPSTDPMNGMHLAQGGTQTTIDPALAGVNAHVASMIRRGRSEQEVRSYLDGIRPGLGSTALNLKEAIQYSHIHPDVPPNVLLDHVQKPLTPVGSLMNAAAQSPVGAATIGAADFLTGGTLDNITSNPALTRAEMAGVAQAHPYWSAGGQIAGAAGLGAGVELGLGRLGVGGLTSVLGADVIPNAAYGAGSADDDGRGFGAALGAGVGLAGGLTSRGLGGLVSGVADRGVRALAARGIRLTPGQMMGGIPKRLEDAATSVPILGDLIRSQRTRGIEDFNRAAFGEALQPIGAQVDHIGEAGVGQAQQAVGQAYQNALGGHSVTSDPQFVTDMTGALAGAQAIPRVGTEVADSLHQIIPDYFDHSGNLTGANMQPMLQELRGFRGGYRNDPLGSRVAARVTDAENAVTGMFERQAPDVMPAFNDAQTAYGRLATVEDAVNAARNADGRFMPSQLGTAAVANTKRYAGKRASARGDRPFFDLQRNAQNVLPSTLPDSGTATRGLIMGALAVPTAIGGTAGYTASGDVKTGAEGAGAGLGASLAVAGALASPYLSRRLLQYALTGERPAAVQSIGRGISASRLPGALGIPLLAPAGGQ